MSQADLGGRLVKVYVEEGELCKTAARGLIEGSDFFYEEMLHIYNGRPYLGEKILVRVGLKTPECLMKKFRCANILTDRIEEEEDFLRLKPEQYLFYGSMPSKIKPDRSIPSIELIRSLFELGDVCVVTYIHFSKDGEYRTYSLSQDVVFEINPLQPCSLNPHEDIAKKIFGHLGDSKRTVRLVVCNDTDHVEHLEQILAQPILDGIRKIKYTPLDQDPKGLHSKSHSEEKQIARHQ